MQMVWSIYKDTSGDYDDWQEMDAAIFFDMDCKGSPHNQVRMMHDGIHEVWYDGFSTTVEVKDGKFNIPQAKVSIGEIVEKAGYWGNFIERFYRRNGKFEVSMGS